MKNTLKIMLLFVATMALFQPTLAKQQPNILFIFIDDLGYKDLTCYGSPLIETPHIDKLASDGMKFKNAYAYAVCTPTRSSLISGQNSARTNVWEVIGENGAIGVVDKPYARMKSPEKAVAIPDGIITYADILKKEGYSVAHVGKWHAGRTPEEEGFDNIDKAKIKDPKLVAYAHHNEEWEVGAYTAKAIEYIREHKDGPFMMNLHHHAVHAPIKGRKDLIAKYQAKIKRTGVTCIHPEYAAMTEMVDESVGVLMDELDNLGLTDNTIVVFYSDNGGMVGDIILNEPLGTTLLPLRGQKGGLYEGGIRVPLIVKWPGAVTPGTTSYERVMCFDLFSTFVEMGGGKIPSDQVCDGLSIVPIVKQEKETLGRDALYWHFPTSQWTRTPQGAIIKGDYKLVEDMVTGRVELFNITDDIGETVNLATAKPEITRDLLDDLKAWRKEMGAELPTLNPNFDPTRENEMGKAIW